MTGRAVVIGGGFRGLMAAFLLARGGKEVTLVERSPYLGSVLYSREWDGLFLDNGCHMFDNSDDARTGILLDLLEGRVVGFGPRYMSVTEGHQGPGMAIPDLSFATPDQQMRWLYELLDAAVAPPSRTPRTLLEHWAARFGPSLADRLATCSRKVLLARADDLDVEAKEVLGFERIRIVPDRMGEVLKAHPLLDERLAVSSASDPTRFTRDRARAFPHRNFYPLGKGMRSFCDSVQSRLEQIGVTLLVRTSVEALRSEPGRVTVRTDRKLLEADLVCWAQDLDGLEQVLLGTQTLADRLMDVPMLVYYFRLSPDQAQELDYYQDYSEDSLVFRGSNAGRYGKQQGPDDLTYCIAEVPAAVDSPTWTQAETNIPRVWEELMRAELVVGPIPAAVKIARVPRTYRVPRAGYRAALDDLLAKLESLDRRILYSHHVLFGRSRILSDLFQQLEPWVSVPT